MCKNVISLVTIHVIQVTVILLVNFIQAKYYCLTFTLPYVFLNVKLNLVLHNFSIRRKLYKETTAQNYFHSGPIKMFGGGVPNDSLPGC